MPRPNSFATVADLAARVGEPIEAPEDVAMATSMLALVSAQIRALGAPWPSVYLAPDSLWAITVEAAARAYLNPAGYSIERADSLTLTRSDPFAAGGTLTRAETAIIKRESGYSSLWQAQVVRDVAPSDQTVVLSGNE